MFRVGRAVKAALDIPAETCNVVADTPVRFVDYL